MRDKYEKNIALLEKAVNSHAFITPITEHRRADGSVDCVKFKKKWNDGMKPFEKLSLWPRTPGYDSRDPLQPEPYLVFIPSDRTDAETVSKTILVAHGGGFEIRTGCEGPNVAWYFHQLGYNTAILTYRLHPYSRLDCIADMQRAVRLLRLKKEQLEIDGTVIVMGFSAGGMLCADCAVHFDYGNAQAEDPVERISCRPDAAVVGYGAITSVSFPAPFMSSVQEGTVLNGRTREERWYLAAEKHIRYDTPPFFIWQTLSDDGRYGMNLAKALQDAQIPYELHIFEGGVHGLGMADGENDLGMNVPHITHWGMLCDEWIRIH